MVTEPLVIEPEDALLGLSFVKEYALKREDTEGALVSPARCVVVRAESEDTCTSFRQLCGRGGDRPSGPG